MIRKTLYWIKKKIAARNRTFQSYFEHQPCTIISCNCIGGLLYHDYHEQFLSPTIDLYIKSPDLVDDFLNLPYKKVLFSHKDYQHPEIVYVKKDRNKRMVDDLTKYINTRGTKVYEYYFDFDKWLTGNFETGDCKYER